MKQTTMNDRAQTVDTRERAARRSRQAIAAIVVAFVLLGLAYSVVNPLHEATDELRHYRFVRHIVQRHALPVQGETGCSAQGHHPPLYYAVAAAVTGWIDTGRDVCYEPPKNPFWAYRYWEVGNDNKNQYLHGADEAFPWRGEALAAHLARVVNVLFGAATVWLTWAIGRTIWPERPFLAVGGAAFVAFNPMFLYLASAINNDVIAAFAGAAVTLGCVRLLRDEAGLRPRWGIILGALYGLALMSKFNLAAIGVTIAAAVTWVAWRRRQWRQWFVVGVLAALVVALLAGWWFVRNQMLYGEPTGFQRLTELWGVRDPAESLGVALFELPYVWTSLWGRFGYGQVPLPQPFYTALWWVAVFCLAGLALPAVRRRWDVYRESGIYLLILALNVALFFAVIFNYLLVSPAGPMGRFFFPALPSLALLMFFGLSLWPEMVRPRAGEERPLRRERSSAFLSLLVGVGMLGLALVALFGYLQPAFARPASFTAATALANPIDAQFGGFVTLRGYSVSHDTVQPGEPIDVDLYWEVTGRPPGNYLLFVHLIDEMGTMVAQRDTHPGLGNFPSSLWQPGDRFVESLRLYLPETAYAPAAATLSVGFYAPVEGYRLGITAADGESLGDALPLGQIAVAPRTQATAAIPNPLDENFGDKFRLAGYGYNGRLLEPGDVLAVSLQWQALVDDPGDYVVQLRLLDENGQIVQTVAQRPQGGAAPTDTWQAGQAVVDRHEFVLNADLAPGAYRVQVALEEATTEERLNILAPDGHWIDDRLLLAPLRVQPDLP